MCWSKVIAALKSNKCIARVDGSFFPEYKESMSTHWKFIFKKKILGYGGFVAKVPMHLQLAHAAEACSVLGVLSVVKEALDGLNERSKIDLCIRTDCQSTIHRFLSKRRVISLDSKLSY